MIIALKTQGTSKFWSFLNINEIWSIFSKWLILEFLLHSKVEQLNTINHNSELDEWILINQNINL